MAIESYPTITVPLKVEPSGVIHIFRPEQTRVNFELVVLGYKAGETPEETHRRLPTVDIADIHLIIAYYLHNTEEVESYLRAEEEEWVRIKAEIDARHPDNAAFRARLQARLDAAQQQRAS